MKNERYYEIEHESPNAIRLGDLTVYVEVDSATGKRPMLRPGVAEIDRILLDYFGVSFVCSWSKDYMYKRNFIFNRIEDYQILLIIMACRIMGCVHRELRTFLAETQGQMNTVDNYCRVYRSLWDRGLFVRHKHPFFKTEHILADKQEYLPKIPKAKQHFRIGEHGFYEIKPTVLPELKIARPSFRLNFD